MKDSLFLFALFFGVLFLFPADSHGQWQPVIRLTNAPGESWTSPNNARSIAASGDVLHVVWHDWRHGQFSEIYYKRSTDGGVSWGADLRLTNTSVSAADASVSVTGPVVHVVWHDYRDGNPEIYYKRSTDGGVSWGDDTRLTNDSANSTSSSVAVSGSDVHVVWNDTRDGNPEIYYKRSTDGGVSWGDDTRLTNDPANSWFSSVSVSGQVVHVVWYDFRDDVFGEIYYKRSTDGGVSWGTDIRLTNNPASSWFPSASVSGSAVHVVWHDYRDGNSEIYHKRSIDGGLSWETDTRLTNNPEYSEFASVSVSASVVHVAWHDWRDEPFQIYYKRSADGGITWDGDLRLTNSSYPSEFPSVAVSGQFVHVIWTDYRDTTSEIYYTRNPTGNATGVGNPTGEIPEEYALSQNYPNPFNPTTTIGFALPKSSFARLIIYDAIGRELETIVNEQLSAGTYEAVWDAGDYTSGVYYYTLSSGEGIKTKRMLLMK